MPFRLAAALVASALLACATAPAPAHRFGHGPAAPAERPLVAPTVIEYGPGLSDQVLEQAAALLRDTGHTVLPPTGPAGKRLLTAPLERDAPCRVTSCLVREVVRVEVGYRRATLRVERVAFAFGLTVLWEPLGDQTSAADILRVQSTLALQLASRIPTRLRLGGGPRTGTLASVAP